MKKLLTAICIGLFILGSNSFVYAIEESATEQQNQENISEQTAPAPDFGPYMRNMQRKIKRNWNPPSAKASNKVVLLYTLDREGNVKKCSVLKSSGLKKTDKAAKEALYKSAPFGNLPAEYKGKSIDVQFTFDYNVFGASTQDRI